jgi:hypothetical protein
VRVIFPVCDLQITPTTKLVLIKIVKKIKTKTTAIVLAAAMASPAAFMGISMADGGKRGPTILTAPVSTTRTNLEAETKDLLTGAEMEAEYSKRTRGADTLERFGAEFEIVDPNSLGVDENTVLEIHVNVALSCTFKTPGILETELRHRQTVQKVEFRAGIQHSNIGGVDTIKEVGDCGKLVPAVNVGDTAEIFIQGTQKPILTGTFKVDD